MSDKEDITRGLEALRELLLTDRYRYATIALPMPGTGLGGQSYEIVQPLMEDSLSDLEATIFLCMAPAKTEIRPQYLVIVGPPGYGLTEEDRSVIDDIIDKACERWNTPLSSYTGIVSGGYEGVDQYICGEHQNKDYENTYVYKKTGKIPLIVKPNKARNGVGAGLRQGNALCEIADSIILFKPVGYNNNRMSAMQMWIEQDKPKRLAEGKHPRRIATFGEKDIKTENNKLIIPVSGSDF